jgi:hypothetical protein
MIGDKNDPFAPWVLGTSDTIPTQDDEGEWHLAFQQDRRLVMLSLPKSIKVSTYEKFIIRAIQQAMEAD